MTKAEELFAAAVSLPIDIRTQLVDKPLQSLHPTTREIDGLWAAEAERRVEEIRSGKADTIPGEEVFEKTRTNKNQVSVAGFLSIQPPPTTTSL